jgi:hypothetical protein
MLIQKTPETPLEYFVLDITNCGIARETNLYAQTFLENTPNLKVRSRAHHWKETNKNEIMKLLAFFLLQRLHQKPDNELFFSQENSGNTHIFGPVQ